MFDSFRMLRAKNSCADGFQMPTGTSRKATEDTLNQWKLAKRYGEKIGKIFYPNDVNTKPTVIQFCPLNVPQKIRGIADKGNNT